MTIKQLHQLTGALMAQKLENAAAEVAIDYSSFMESENGNILAVESGELIKAQGADDSGPVGDEFPFLVLRGGLELHNHGDPI